MHETATTLANAMPNGQHRTLEGQTHEVAAEALAPVLVEFFAGADSQSPVTYGLTTNKIQGEFR